MTLRATVELRCNNGVRSGIVLFFSLSPIFGQLLIYVFNKGAVPTDSNFDISFRLPRVLNAAEHISKA